MSKAFDKKDYKNELIQTKEVKSKRPLDFKKAVISFSKVSPNQRIEYIYLGHEKMSFRMRHPTYQILFRNEFARTLRVKNKQSNFGRGSTKFSTSF